MTTNPESFREILFKDLAKAEALSIKAFETSSIIRSQEFESIIVAQPDFVWDESTEQTTQLRTEAKNVFDQWRSSSRPILDRALPDVQPEFERLCDKIDNYLTRMNDSWGLPSTLEQAITQLKEDFVSVREIIDQNSSFGNGGTLVVVDTNALIDNNDLETYPKALGTDIDEIWIPQVVLSELDNLKKTQKIKVQEVHRALEMLMDNGYLTDGISCGSMLVKSPDSPPPEWAYYPCLGQRTPDDQIVANALTIRARNPRAVVYLATSDLNMKAKSNICHLGSLSMRTKQDNSQTTSDG